LESGEDHFRSRAIDPAKWNDFSSTLLFGWRVWRPEFLLRTRKRLAELIRKRAGWEPVVLSFDAPEVYPDIVDSWGARGLATFESNSWVRIIIEKAFRT